LTSDKVEMFYLTRNKDTGEVFTQTLSLWLKASKVETPTY
jgi:hypothetical protein